MWVPEVIPAVHPAVNDGVRQSEAGLARFSSQGDLQALDTEEAAPTGGGGLLTVRSVGDGDDTDTAPLVKLRDGGPQNSSKAFLDSLEASADDRGGAGTRNSPPLIDIPSLLRFP